MSRRRFLVLLFALLVPHSPVHARQWVIRDVFLERFTGEDFRRLSRCFSRRPPRPRNTTCRTDGGEHRGLYAILLLNHATGKLPAETDFRWEFLRDGEPVGECVCGTVGEDRRPGRELWIGLTDDGHADLLPRDIVAWRITLLADGQPLCSWKSFLFPADMAAEYACQAPAETQEGDTER